MRRRPSLGVLDERDFRMVFGAQVVSLVGDGVVPVALSFAVLELTGSATDLGIVLAAETVPLILCVLIGGVVADRISRRRVMIAADLVRLVTQTLLALLLITGSAHLWQVAVLQIPLGAASGFFNPATTGLLPDVTSAARLQDANALLATASASGSVAGPVIAGILVATLGPGHALLIDAFSYGVSAAFLWRLHVTERVRDQPNSFMSDLRAGWDEVRSRTWVWASILVFSIAVMLSASFYVLGPVVAKARLGGAGAWAAIIAARGAGGVGGSLVVLRLQLRRPLLFALRASLVATLPSLLLAAGAATLPIAIAAALAGAGVMIFNTIWQTTVQRHVPPGSLSRVTAYDWLGSLALFPLGLALAGPISEAVGVSTTLYASVVIEFVTVCSLLLVRQVRTLGPGRVGAEAEAEPQADATVTQ